MTDVPQSLTLADAMSLYQRYSPDLSRARIKNFQAAINRWTAFNGPLILDQICTGNYADYRRYAKGLNLAVPTIEGHINCLRALLRHCGPVTDSCPHGLGLIAKVPWVGKRLQWRPQPKPAVPLEHLSAVYQVADLSRRPTRAIHPTIFWRVYLVVAYNTGLRGSDLLGSLTWANYDAANHRLVAIASKTGKRHEFAVNSVVTRHLAMLPRVDERIFPLAPSNDGMIRRQLGELCELAGVPRFTPQWIRRRAATEYERVHPGSGALLLGHILPGMGMTWMHYIDPCEVLSIAAGKVAQPAAFLPPQGG